MANIVIDSAEYFYFDLDVKFLLNEDSNGDPLSYTRENLYDSAAFEFDLSVNSILLEDSNGNPLSYTRLNLYDSAAFEFDLDVNSILLEDSNGDPLSYTWLNLYDSAAFEFSQVEYFHIEKQTDKIKKTAYGEASQKETWG